MHIPRNPGPYCWGGGGCGPRKETRSGTTATIKQAQAQLERLHSDTTRTIIYTRKDEDSNYGCFLLNPFYPLFP